MTKKIIYRLREARKMKGLSLRKASELFGKSHEWLNKYEKGLLPMSSEKLIMFANVYGVSPDYLMPNENRPKIELTDVRFFKMPKNI